MECAFCSIRNGQIPAVVVAEDERALAIMDINPINDGHVLVIPRAHAATFFEIAEEDLIAAIRLAKRIATGIRKGLAPDGLNLIQNNGAAASQSVPHFHLHLIPRWVDDGKGLTWELIPGSSVRIRQMAAAIRAAL
jgi:histidine triad (HIT) family protein